MTQNTDGGWGYETNGPSSMGMTCVGLICMAMGHGISPEFEPAGPSDPGKMRVKPALQEAGARYLARGGAHKVYEGDWAPRRIVLLEFPSVAAWEAFYNGPVYQGLKEIRDGCSSAAPW